MNMCKFSIFIPIVIVCFIGWPNKQLFFFIEATFVFFCEGEKFSFSGYTSTSQNSPPPLQTCFVSLPTAQGSHPHQVHQFTDYNHATCRPTRKTTTILMTAVTTTAFPTLKRRRQQQQQQEQQCHRHQNQRDRYLRDAHQKNLRTATTHALVSANWRFNLLPLLRILRTTCLIVGDPSTLAKDMVGRLMSATRSVIVVPNTRIDYEIQMSTKLTHALYTFNRVLLGILSWVLVSGSWLSVVVTLAIRQQCHLMLTIVSTD